MLSLFVQPLKQEDLHHHGQQEQQKKAPFLYKMLEAYQPEIILK